MIPAPSPATGDKPEGAADTNEPSESLRRRLATLIVGAAARAQLAAKFRGE